MKIPLTREQIETLETVINDEQMNASDSPAGALAAYAAEILLERIARQTKEQAGEENVTLRMDREAATTLEFILEYEVREGDQS